MDQRNSHAMSAFLAIALLALLASPTPSNAQGATAAGGAKTPATTGLCPITGKAPVKPEGSLPRCQSEQALACCDQCTSAGSALSILSKNGSVILGFLRTSDPDLTQLFASFQKTLGGEPLCKLFEKDGQCLNMIEALSCALNCDAKAATYLTVVNGNATLKVCDGFASQMFEACKGLKIPNMDQTIGDNIDNAQDLLSAVVDPLVASATSLTSLNSTVVPSAQGKCFSGPTGNAYPTVNLCCDPMSSVPSQCFQAQVVSKVAASTPTNLQTLVNRPLPTGCPAAGNPAGTPAAGGSNSTKGAVRAVGATSALASLVLGTAAVLALGF